MKLVILSLFFSVFAQASDWPKPTTFDCNYYLELEQHLNCQENGSRYLIDFGYAHCRRFQDSSVFWSPAPKDFISGSGFCLMETLYKNRSSRIPNCQALEEFAFNSHANCYKQAGYCELNTIEKLQIGITIDWLSFLTRFHQIKTQIENIYSKCSEDLI